MFDHLLGVSTTNLTFLKTFDSDFSYTEIWFTDENFKGLDIEDRIKFISVINWCMYIK